MTKVALLRILRQAFDRTMKDPDFAKEADRIGIEVNPKSGGEIGEIVRSVYASPALIIDEARKLLGP